MAGSRIGYPAAPRTPPQERVLGFVLLCLFLALAVLLVGACSSQEDRIGVGAGGSGAGGDGLGGQGGNTSCLTGADGCVQSCSADPGAAWGQAYCDATGSFACPSGFVRYSTCAANACVQPIPTCCDETSGGFQSRPAGRTV